MNGSLNISEEISAPRKNLSWFKTMLKSIRELQINTWAIFFFLVYLVLVLKFMAVKEFAGGIFFTSYGLAITLYILSRFFIAYFYANKVSGKYLPSVTFGVPAKNEEDNIKKTLLKIMESDYPKNKYEIIAVNDGSTDKTLEEMKKAQAIAKLKGINLKIIDWSKNKGKREGMAECIRQSRNEIIVFVDSDSFLDHSATKELVKPFEDKKVGAVAGHAYVANINENIYTKMQAVRYFVAFKAYKATESVFGSVTCCSGCCAAYRREYLLDILEPWQNQTFMGSKCTYGDDRSLTNFILKKGYNAIYASNAIAYTVVPNSYKQFMRQQLRWKKSWFRESWNACKFIWKRNPIMSISFYLGFILPLLAPIVLLRAVVWYPIISREVPYYYVFGFLLMAALYGIYYTIYTKDKKWFYGILFSLFYVGVLVWQLPYAILTIRDSRWGTR